MSFYIKHSRVTLDCGTEEITKQGHKDECDIHKILNQYKRTGILTHITTRQALYADLPDCSDYQSSINTVLEGQEAFATLPASVRDRFKNDPANFLAAIGDPSMRAELEELGVFKKRAPEPSASPVPASEA